MEQYLGKVFTDTLTGITGTATAHVRYLDGMEQVCLQPMCYNNNFREPRYVGLNNLVEQEQE